MSKTDHTSDGDAQQSSSEGSSRLGGASRRGVLQTAGAGIAGAGLSWTAGTASAAGINLPPLARDGNQIVDPQGEKVTLRGVSIADPGEQARCWRGMDSQLVFDMATSHSDWYNTMIRVPMQASFIYTGDVGASPTPPCNNTWEKTPAPEDMPHGDDWGPTLPGTYDQTQLEDYLSAYIDPLVQQAEENGAYIMLDYHRHYPVFHHEENHEYYTNPDSYENRDGVDVSQVWECTSTSSVDHTAAPGTTGDFEAYPGGRIDACGERGLLWHGEDQIDEVQRLAEEQAVWEYMDEDASMSGPDDIYTEPPEVCNALDAELELFWEVVAREYGDNDHVIFDIYNEPTGPYAGDWGGVDRTAGALSDALVPDDRFELWGEFAKPYYDLWRDRSQPWVELAENEGSGQVLTVGSPRWSQYTYWAPYNEYDAENVAYTSHVYLQDNCRPLEMTVGEAAEQVPVFFSEFGWMDFDLTVPTPWMTRDEKGINWADGDTDPTGGMSYSTFIEEFDVHPVCWAFDHSYEPNFFEHGTPGDSDGAKDDEHWYDNGYLLDEHECCGEDPTPGRWWRDFVADKSSNSDFDPNSGSSRYDGDMGPNELNGTCGGYASDTLSAIAESHPDYVDCGTPPGDCPEGTNGEAEVEGQTVCSVQDDDLYRDFNADGSVTQGDVTEFFSVQHKEGFQNNPGMFDFNGNGDVGLDDVVYLFQQL